MSNCIKDSYDYVLIKKCSNCEIISLKCKFQKNENMKNGLQPHCISCVKHKQKRYYNANPDKKKLFR